MMRIGLACAATLLAAGCSTSTGITKPADATSSASATATAQPQVPSTLTAPHPPPNHWNDGTSYDPCLTYTAEQIRAWGVDPAQVDDRGVEDRQLRGCRWSADGWSVELSVANTKVSSYLDAKLFDNPRSVTVAGLQAVQYDGGIPQAPACTVILPVQNATVAVVVAIVDPKRAKGVSDACAKSIEVATAVAPSLPK
ncbi:DUF3558 family protein [Mycobacteroides abscessus subsp. abscessus]|uniref:DUF3558 family protein n=2 Tax=Mycobacteroides abscessus TaxID=36809 RepID=UPI00092CAC0D|nr:DUF3558 family protein [Mycobacteroides abscessus]MDO3093251.1 DUF3558 family protein [Mycobacteroides abscessus subsp. abscessus]PVB51619.1 DUF3558 domain-containing protein [Mycobacteroides abscessus]RIR69946.1 DUF3558 domain-containing protein [Mycobacteroides abscessus]SHX81731.1 Protein of uncharacterised function (DUF3558) [Mycobacteroides abscessus subsp. abscessus]SHY69235.1 Protein of uncharacterised function (DUF3558) [Mycobacteroides abscessus subsp. abscessus]